MTQIIEESGLRITFPDVSCFRFQDLSLYRSLSGQSLKEMDFAWCYDSRIHLLEIRDYRQIDSVLNLHDLVPSSPGAAPRRFAQLIDKVTDSLLLLLASWAGTQKGSQLLSELPITAQQMTPIRLVIALGLPENLNIHLGTLREAINARLKGRVALADVTRIAVLDYERLCQNALSLGIECEQLPVSALTGDD